MNKTTKALLGSAAVAVVGAVGSAAYYADNVVIPERLAAELNNAAADAYAPGKTLGDITVEKSDDITVERTGFLTYKANMPSFSVKVDTSAAGIGDNIKTTITLAPSTYNIQFTNKLDTFTAVTMNEFGMASGKPMTATLQSNAPLTFNINQSIETVGSYAKPLEIDIKGTCDSMTHDAVLNGEAYKLATNSSDCSLASEINDQGITLNFFSDMVIDSTIAKDSDNNYTGDENLTLQNMKIDLTEYGRPIGGVDIEELRMSISYDGLQKSTKNAENISMTDSFNIGFNLKKLSARGLPVQSPVVDLGGSFHIDGMNADKRDIKLAFNYDIDNLSTAGLLPPAASDSLPTSFACETGLTDVTKEQFDRLLEGADPQKMQQSAMTGNLAVQAAEDFNGIGFKLNCDISNDDFVRALLQMDHKMEEGVFPGSGKLELQGFNNLMRSAAMIFGPYQASAISMTFSELAKPTEDGKGMLWRYDLDKAGNLTINGTPIAGPAYEEQRRQKQEQKRQRQPQPFRPKTTPAPAVGP